ncbi:MAG: hypothetical protein ACLFUC_03675 [Bacteroidales bacterium]
MALLLLLREAIIPLKTYFNTCILTIRMEQPASMNTRMRINTSKFSSRVI